ncbi:CBS domain-containing protein [Pyrofollis japonicus]|uniref:CBS domain-containing protein n=1 Tax=Pyrofollis japonicus TaxID=3060460 RepID=UPI00295AF8D7|nr:CBS domain-containing protein [Pyrofollis japonicus]BEP18203.1 CBS domain-containing protein [Pyrofollis japonicus]
MKIWEVARKPRVVVTADIPATAVRAMLRDNEEPIAVIVNNEKEMKLVGYVTWREIIQITSHYSHLRAKDIALDWPVAYKDDDIETVVKRMEEEKVYAVPVVDSPDNPVVIGVASIADIVRGLMAAGFEPIAETVAEVMTTEDLEEYITYQDERVNKVWSDIVYHGKLGKVVVRSKEEPIPVGIISLREFVATGRWFFHRESERGLKSIAKVKTIMLRGAPVATPETPIQYVAKIMVENDFPILPVIDEETGKIIGVITIFDVARAYLEGAKPGRVKPAKKAALPIEVKPEERVTYATTQQVLQQVLVARPPVESLVGLSAAGIARAELPAVTINDTVEHARRMMLRYRTNYLLVVDEKGQIVGVVSKWSMLRAIGLKGPIWKRRVHDRYFIDYIMDTEIPRVKPDDSIEKVALMMAQSKAEVAIVEDEKGQPIGFITKDDIVEAYAQYMRGRARVENIMTPGRIGIVHPHHSLYHAVKKMQTFYLDALTVYDGSQILGVVSANRLPFVAYEDAVTGIKSRRLIWVRKLVRGAARKGRYVKVTPLLVLDAMVPLRNVYVKTSDDVVKAIELMKQHNVDGIPVVDEEGKVVGVVTKTDIIRELARTARLRIERGETVKVEERKAKPPEAK